MMRRAARMCAVFSFVVLLVPGIASAAPRVPTADLPRPDPDPFAPPGTFLVRTPIPSREAMTELQRMGLQPEEAGRTEVLFRVNEVQLARMKALGLEVQFETAAQAPAEAVWTTYAQMASALQQIAANYPGIARLVSIGKSVENRDLWALCVSANVNVEEAEPEVRVVGAHHGNEKMSAELCLDLAQDLTQLYGTDSQITALVDSLEIWIVPIVNPDGYEANSRYNAHSVDINRNYGYMWETGGGSAAFSEPEPRAMRDLATENWFVVSLSFHTSGDVVNSVWNYTPIRPEDDAVVVQLSNLYASFNGYWAVHGWDWYETHGDCNDWSYGARADLDWTIETANSNETAVWNANRPAILAFLDAARWGVHGVVTDAVTGEPLRARVTVAGNGWPAFTDPAVGDYHKPLLAGTYDLTISSNGHQDLVVPGVVVPSGGGVRVNAALLPGGGRFADRIETASVPDPNNAHANHSLTMSVLGAPDGVGCSIGVGGSIVVDMGVGSEVADHDGDDLTVHEAPGSILPEGYSVYGGNAWNGPWTLIGAGVGTHSFDLAATALDTVRYVRVVDDGNGNPNDPDAGFALDAIEVIPPTVFVADAAPRPALALAAWPEPTTAARGLDLKFTAPSSRAFALDLFDVTGARIVRLAAVRAAGAAQWNGRDAAGRRVPAGVYFLRLTSEDGTLTRKVHVVP
jgi:hypothetical protein